jgi:hypothetical protein
MSIKQTNQTLVEKSRFRIFKKKCSYLFDAAAKDSKPRPEANKIRFIVFLANDIRIRFIKNETNKYVIWKDRTE